MGIWWFEKKGEFSVKHTKFGTWSKNHLGRIQSAPNWERRPKNGVGIFGKFGDSQKNGEFWSKTRWDFVYKLRCAHSVCSPLREKADKQGGNFSVDSPGFWCPFFFGHPWFFVFLWDSTVQIYWDQYDVSILRCAWHFLIRLPPPPDTRGLLPTPKETYDLNLSNGTSSIWSFRTPQEILCEGPEF